MDNKVMSNGYCESGLKMVIEAVKKEMAPEALRNLGKAGNTSPLRKHSSIMQHIRTNLKKLSSQGKRR